MVKEHRNLACFLLRSVICLFVAYGFLVSVVKAEAISATLEPIPQATANVYAFASADIEVQINNSGEIQVYTDHDEDEASEIGSISALATPSYDDAIVNVETISEISVSAQGATSLLKHQGSLEEESRFQGSYQITDVTCSGMTRGNYSGSVTIGTNQAFPAGTGGLTLLVDFDIQDQGYITKLLFEIGSEEYDLINHGYSTLKIPVTAGETLLVLMEGNSSFSTSGESFCATASFAVVPEPSTLIMLPTLLGLVFLWRKHK